MFSANLSRGTDFGLRRAMTSSMRASFVTAISLAMLSGASTAWCQEAENSGFAKTGPYIAVSAVPDFKLDGVTFDGLSAYKQIDGDEFMILPRLQPKNTVRAIFGVRSRIGAFEFGYEQTDHEGTFMDLSGEATFHALNFDERIFFLTRGRIQPYGLVGMSVPWLTVKDGSFLDEQVGDASFRGWGLNTEAGVTVFVHPRVGISAGYRHRAMWFTTAHGVSDTAYTLRPRFRETSGSVAFNALFTF